MATAPSTSQPVLTYPGAPAAGKRKWPDFVGPTIALVVIFVFFMFTVPEWTRSDFSSFHAFYEQICRFANFGNIAIILRQSTMTGVAALGVTFIIIAGGIDLSAGSLAALVCTLVAVVLQSGTPAASALQSNPLLIPLLAVTVGIAVGVLCGLINGALITSLKIVPFIITLGTMMIFRGTAKYFGHETNVPTARNWLWAIMGNPDEHGIAWLIFPPAIWITLFLAVLMALILNYSRFGRHVIAIGSNENTARLCGINVERTKLIVYTLGGLFVGIAGLFFYSRLTQGSPTCADAFELDVIASVVIGGGSLTGGKGSIWGSLIGALILNVIARGCGQIHIPVFLQHNLPSIFSNPTGLPTYVQQIVTGVIIIVAVLLDKLRQRRNAA
jgi:ribose/xylose/arabinose/galactoside ABC-type transport system permease subunit